MDEKPQRDQSAKLRLECVREIQQQLAGSQRTGLAADKAFFDELSGDTDGDPLKPDSR